jgi:hypothetical protein
MRIIAFKLPDLPCHAPGGAYKIAIRGAVEARQGRARSARSLTQR